MRDVPYAANDVDVLLALAHILHKHPFPGTPRTNFHVELFSQSRSSSHRGMGILTVPTESIGTQFLALYGSTGLYLKGRSIRFSKSNKPLSRGVLERIKLSAWEDPVVLQRDRERKAQGSKPIPLHKVFYGHFCRDGSFSAEDSPPGKGRVACDLILRQLKLTMDQWKDEDETDLVRALEELDSLEFMPTTSAIYSPSQIKTLIASGVSSSSPVDAPPCIFLESSTHPIFEQQTFVSSHSNNAWRCSSLLGDRVMSPGCNVLCLVFTSRGELNMFRDRCRELRLPNIQNRNIIVRRYPSYSHDKLTQLFDFLKSLDFGLAFQVYKAVTTLVLEPLEAISLKADIQKLNQEYGTQAYALFQYFAKTLGGSRRELPSRERRRKARRRVVAAAQAQLHPPSLSQQLEEAVAAYAKLQNQLLSFSFTSPTFYWSYHLIITPSDRILEGPLPDQSNSVLRRFGNHECFLRVSFYDEDRSKIRHDPSLSVSLLLKRRFGAMLNNGFRFLGRSYQFLGYSMSGLKDHSVWFVTPFVFEGRKMNAHLIRQSLVCHHY